MKSIVEFTRLSGTGVWGDFLQSWKVSAGKLIKPAEEGNDYKHLLPS